MKYMCKVKKIFCNKLCKKHYNKGQLRKVYKENAKCEQIIINKSYMNFISNEQYMSSWAVWSKQNGKNKSGMEDISFFNNPSKKTLDTLNPNIILVGLNISEKIDRVFGNFHPNKTKAQDYKTRYALQDTMFCGAYMTDIIKSFEEKISVNLMKYLNKNKRFEKENIEKFEQELVDMI